MFKGAYLGVSDKMANYYMYKSDVPNKLDNQSVCEKYYNTD